MIKISVEATPCTQIASFEDRILSIYQKLGYYKSSEFIRRSPLSTRHLDCNIDARRVNGGRCVLCSYNTSRAHNMIVVTPARVMIS